MINNSETIISSNESGNVWLALIKLTKPTKVEIRDLKYHQINGKDKIVTYSTGTYLIEQQSNRQFAYREYFYVTEKQAKELVDVDYVTAVDIMKEIVAGA